MTLSAEGPDSALALAIRAAREAGRLMLSERSRLSPQDVAEKGPNDFVTRVDRLLEDLIRERIRAEFPADSFLAEEGGITAGDNGRLWIVDPLDGTTNYIRGIPLYSVSIALAEEGRVVASAIFDALHDEMFEALRGKGTALNGKPVRVADRHSLAGALLGTGLPSRFKENLPGHLDQQAKTLREAGGLRRLGSAALGLAYVACGRLDGFWEPRLAPWDMAAGSLIVEEAGGQVSGDDLSPWTIESRGIVAANPTIFGLLRPLLRPPS